MLVLARNEKQKVVFPRLGIVVSVESVRGKRVKLGFEAPRDVAILREELSDQETVSSHPGRIDRHAIRNRLNAAVLSLHVLAQSTSLAPDEVEDAIAKALWELDELNQELEGATELQGAKCDSSTASERDERSSSQRGHALIVEDNDNERELLAAYMRMRGFDVTEAADGAAAIQYLESNELPDVVLLDMNMPRLNGVKTISRIREMPEFSDMKVFGVSGTDRSQWRLPSGDQGVDKWFQKPINPESVVKELEATTSAI